MIEAYFKNGVCFASVDKDKQMSDGEIFVAMALLESQCANMFGLDQISFRMTLDETMKSMEVRPNIEETTDVEVIK